MDESHNSLRKVKLAAVLLLVLVLAGLGYVYYQKNHSSSTDKSAAVPAGWAEYKNDEYGFSFIHPQSWGNPQFNETHYGQGKQYTIDFNNDSDEMRIFITMESENIEKKVCVSESDCKSLEPVTKTFIEKQLASNKDGFISYDNSYYALVISNSKQKLQSGLEIYSVKNLPMINVSAIQASYYLLGNSSDCPSNGLSNKAGCLDKAALETTVKVIKSIK